MVLIRHGFGADELCSVSNFEVKRAILPVGSTAHVCFMIPGTELQDWSCSIEGVDKIRFDVRKNSNAELAKSIGIAAQQLQFVAFNPYAVPDGNIRITVRVPWQIEPQCEPLKLQHSHGHLVVELRKQVDRQVNDGTL